MDIDPRLREPSQGASQPYSSLPPPSYPLNPIRLPPPPHQQQQQQQQQQHQSGLPPWPQDRGHPYYSYRPDQQPHNLPPPDIQSHHDPSFGPSQQGDGGFSESKRPRACEACRGLKVRCEPDPVKRTCRRCSKAGRTCVVTAPSRKRQKKTDSRVAELEKKIEALTASLHVTRGQAASDSDEDDSYDEVEQHSNDPTGASAGRKRRISEYQQDVETPDHRMPPGSNNYVAMPPTIMPPDNSNIHPFLMAEKARPPPPPMGFSPGPPFVGNEHADVVDRNILDAATAFDIFYHFTKNMASHIPIVVFPADVTAENIRKDTPTLFLAILSVASGQDYPSLQRILIKEITRTLADRIVYNGEKSLEFVQALQVLTVWYWPEDDRDTKYYQLIHMAAVMAVDLGIGKPSKSGKDGSFAQSYQRLKAPLVNHDAIESKRAWLGCYFLCANASMGLRRPNLVLWDSYTDTCLNEIGYTKDSLPSDKALCEWIRLQRITEDAERQVVRDEISVLGVSDSKAQNWLKGFERKVEDWDTQKSAQVSSLPLTLELHYVNLYMHDFAMNLHHDCKGKSISHAQEGDNETHPTSLTPAHQAALRVCLASVHGVLNTFLAFSPQEVRTIPNSAFARVAYASILLIKMHLAASLPESELGKLIPGDEMKVGRYIAGLIDLLRAGAANGKSRPAHNFSLVMAMLQVWYEKQINDRASFSNTVMKGEPEPKLQNGEVQSNPTAPAQREHHQPSHGPSATGQTPLHLLSEVAMGNSGPSGHQVPNGGDSTYDFSPAQANSTNAYKADMYPPSMIGDGLRRMHPGFEQALGMTLSGGDLNVLEDDGFFDLMQKTSNMFESNEG